MMHRLTRYFGSAEHADAWLVELARVLDEQHVAAWSRCTESRAEFARSAADMLADMPQTQVCVIDGRRVHDLGSFCEELARVIDKEPVEVAIDSSRGVLGALCRRPILEDGQAIKRRYFIWSEAHLMLREDASLFGRLLDAMLGIAAEGEYVSDDMLLLQRCVLVGGPALDVYAEDDRGQLKSWYREGLEDPLWGVLTGLRGPSVTRIEIPNAKLGPR